MGIEDHGFDHDGIEDELNEAASDCALIDFDDEFPFDVDLANASHDRKNEFIFKLIQSCWQNPNIVFDLKMSKFNAGLFSIAMADIANAKELYSRQCPVIFNSGMHGDEAFFRTLAIGNNPYLNYLVDSYFRDRCKNEAEIETFFRITRGSIHELGISQLLLDENNADKYLYCNAQMDLNKRKQRKLILNGLKEMQRKKSFRPNISRSKQNRYKYARW